MPHQRPRIYYTETQKALMWERWRKGESLERIANLFDRRHSSVQRILAETGGIQPAPRRRSGGVDDQPRDYAQWRLRKLSREPG